jgi:hypothetical protein
LIDLTLQVPDSARPHIVRHRFAKRDNYEGSIQADYKHILLFLPVQVTRILDIGCGMAGIDVLLKRHYPDAELWLLDSDGDEQRNGWNKSLGAFSSRSAADELLALNGVKADRWIDVNTKEPLKADLVISLASWGYHYPLSTYDVTGFCIADLRRKVEPQRGQIVSEYEKRLRCAWFQKGSL